MGEQLFELQELERFLERSLQEELLLMVPLKVNCAILENRFCISIHICESHQLLVSRILVLVREKIALFNRLPDYPLQTSLVIHDTDSLAALSLSSIVLSPPSTLIRGTDTELSRRSLAIIGLISLGIVGFYGLSRPCILGQCPNLSLSRQLSDRALQNLSPALSRGNLEEIRNDISRSLSLLQSIPPWSPDRAASERSIPIYRNYLRELDYLNLALEKSDRAASLKNDRKNNREIEKLWRDGIDNLSKITADSPFYQISTANKAKFSGNLQAIQLRIKTDREAVLNLEKARQLAIRAKNGQKTARSIPELEANVREWQGAIDLFRSIPPDTPSSREAVRELEIVLPLFSRARERLAKELAGRDNLNKAVNTALLAEKALQKRDWARSIVYWQEALNHLRSVPPESSFSTNLKSLRAKYELYRQRALLERDLTQICTRTGAICKYEVGDRVIRVNLNPAYTDRVQKTAQQLQERKNVKSQLELMNHLSRLEISLQTIADRSRKTVEVYNPDRVLLAVYTPAK